jgi:AcrR family transcriptional regulator
VKAAPAVPPDRARRRDAAGTREALLAAGTELFAEQGYDGVPVAAIAERAGVNKAMINFFFAARRFRERVLARRRPAVKPPDAAAYVKHMQDLRTHGLAARGPGGARGASRRRRS